MDDGCEGIGVENERFPRDPGHDHTMRDAQTVREAGTTEVDVESCARLWQSQTTLQDAGGRRNLIIAGLDAKMIKSISAGSICRSSRSRLAAQ